MCADDSILHAHRLYTAHLYICYADAVARAYKSFGGDAIAA